MQTSSKPGTRATSSPAVPVASKDSKPNRPAYLLRYFSLAPWLAVISISVAFSTWVIFNWFFPDLLFHPLP